MPIFKMPHFGPLDSESLDEYYEVEIDYNGGILVIDLNFGEKKIGVDKLELAKQFIDNIRIHDLKNHKYIEADYSDENGETVRSYLEHHVEELGELELADLGTPGSKPSTYEKQLLKKLHLTRVGIYPEGEDQFAIFDYSLGVEITDYLVVIFTDENGNLDYITMES